ncbi:MAG TPA: matrixin family metalloprotease [Actinomycetota bacterium]|nr:matrixin family metalloprotease [Actinomycetota bacterium]
MRRSLAATSVLGAAALLGAALVSAPVSAAGWPVFDRTTALELAGVDVPIGVGLIVHTDFSDEDPLVVDDIAYRSLTLDITPEGAVITRNAIAGETSEQSEPVGECNDPTFRPLGIQWKAESIPVLWRMDLRSVPDYLEAKKTLETVRSAHRVWPQSRTTCSDDDKNELRYNYLGHTAKNPKYDMTNIVDFGALPARALAQNYTWYIGKEIVEVDLRLNSAYKWTNVEGVNRYQVKNVVTHELGHQVGLDDLDNPHAGLTMYGLIDRGETKKASLGMGDLKGAWAVSP